MHQDREFIPLKNELEYVDNYLVIMEYSGSYDFMLTKEVEEDTLSLLIPRFILQPESRAIDTKNFPLVWLNRCSRNESRGYPSYALE